jgi:predicted permease
MGLLNRVIGLFKRARLERELKEELEHHIELKTQENIEAGMAPDQARHAALRAFGGIEQRKEQCRDADRLRWLEDLIRDLRYGLRQLRRNPGFTAVAVFTLALGIGANTAIFTVVNGVLLRPLSLPHPERVIFIQHSYTNCPGCSGPLSYPNFSDFERQNSVFTRLSMYLGGSFNLKGKGSPQRVPGAFVSANYFATMGIKPVLGRTFLPGEDQTGHNGVAVINASLWHSQFGSDPDILGKTIFLNDEPLTVVGVMPGWFHFPSGNALAWVPLVPDAQDRLNRGMNMYDVVGRLKAGVTLAEARGQMGVIAGRLSRMYPNSDKNETVRMTPLQQAMVGGIREDLLMLMVAVALVFLIASANVANLLLARTAGRQREIAIRLSVGAGRGRLARQFLAESLLLAAAGAVVGWLIALLGVDGLLILKPANLPRVNQIRPDAWVLTFTITLVIVAALALGEAAARRAARFNVQEVLKEGATTETPGPKRIRRQNVLVAGEVAIALTLLVGAGLLVKSLWHLFQVEPGLDAQRVLTMRVSLPETRYPDEIHIARFYTQLLGKIQALPGVEDAGLVTMLPLQQSWVNGDFEIAGRPHDKQNLGQGEAEIRAVSPGYYRALGIPLVQGRFFNSEDRRAATPVVIINEKLARRYWPREDPLGRRIEIGGEPPWYTIVGVVGNVRQAKLSVPIQFETDVPYTQWPPAWPVINGTMSLVLRTVLRTRVDPASMADAARRAVLSVDPDQSVFDVETMQQVVARSAADRRFNMILLGLFAALGLILASLGIYGVLSYSVRQRTHEIGVRVALGATRGDVLGMVVWQGMKVAVIGLACGVGGALLLTHLMAGLLYGVKPNDPFTFVIVSLVLSSVALLACYLPARRAARVDPMAALRYE